MSHRIDAVAVVIPVHDEEALLPDCLAAIEVAAHAARATGARVEIVAALDACSDGSAAIARSAGIHTVQVEARTVGVARSAGVEAALALLRTTPLHGIWTAHTDADSAVPANWLTHQLDLAHRGADVVVGTVRPDFRDLSPEQVHAWWSTHTPGHANGHVHGANLGLRASLLRDLGDFAPLAVHEDVRLVERARCAGARIVASDEAWVRTSGRPIGRAPDGYSRYLREELLDLARSSTPPPEITLA